MVIPKIPEGSVYPDREDFEVTNSHSYADLSSGFHSGIRGFSILGQSWEAQAFRGMPPYKFLTKYHGLLQYTLLP